MLPPVRPDLFYVQPPLLANINLVRSVRPRVIEFGRRCGPTRNEGRPKLQVAKNCPIARAFDPSSHTLAGRIRKEPLGARRVQQAHNMDNLP